MITPEQIYDATNRGLAIIKMFYPQADESGKKFKAREEDDASASIKLYNNVWKFTDFGDEGHSLSPIDICMKEMNLNFPKAMTYLAGAFGVEDNSIRESNRAVTETRPAKEDEKAGDFKWLAKDFTDYELKVLGPKVTAEICKEYSYYSLAWYSRTYKDKKTGELMTTVVNSTDNFPIVMRHCEYYEDGKKKSFQKIYTPLAYKKEFRFSYAGEKPKKWINGLKELRDAAEKYDADQNAGTGGEGSGEGSKPQRATKYPHAVICCGERDALCCAAFGYKPIWFNSETYVLSEDEYFEIAKLVDVLYYIPDLDTTGRRKAIELALRFTDIHLVWLPSWLSEYHDARGKRRKDLRDYAELQPDNATFKKMMALGMPLKFWAQYQDKGTVKYEINTTYLLHFLWCMGFGVYKGERGEEYVRVVDNKVTPVTPSDMRRFIREYVKEQPAKIQNAVLNSSRVNSSTFEQLGEVKLDFTRCTHSSQNFFFANGVVEVNKEEVRPAVRYPSYGFNVWEKQIKQHRFKRSTPAFAITEGADGWHIEVKHQDSNFFKYLIQTSRMYWRDELEYRLAGLTESERETYRAEHKFCINGPKLSPHEIAEQEQHLVNKIFAAGYLLHRYKIRNKAWLVYAMDARISESGEANGRSGKSFFMNALRTLINTVALNGRNEHLTENPHVLDQVTSHTDLVFVDDSHQYLDFNYFYNFITGDMNVNPKRKDQYTIPFEDSPKLAITTNFAPNSGDSSTQGRLLYMAFSDYYHYSGEESTYMESRDIFSDFGKVLLDSQYPEEDWNADYNFLFDCLQFYLSVEGDRKIEPPMSNIKIRMNKQIMGQNFEEWADDYLSVESGNLNAYLFRGDMFDNYQRISLDKKTKAAKFKQKLAAYCQNHNLILNPKEALNTSDGRIAKKREGKTEFCFYIQTPGTPIMPMPDEFPDTVPY